MLVPVLVLGLGRAFAFAIAITLGFVSFLSFRACFQGNQAHFQQTRILSLEPSYAAFAAKVRRQAASTTEHIQACLAQPIFQPASGRAVNAWVAKIAV